MNRSRFDGVVFAAALALGAAGCSSTPAFEGGGGTTLGLPTATVSTTALSFGTIPLGQTSATQTVTITNTGTNEALSLTAPSVKGANPGSFLSSTTCGTLLVKGASCSVSIVFSPQASGALAATLTFSDNSSTGNTQTVALSGTGSSSGPVVSLSASSLTFATLPVGQASTQTLTLTNIGSGALTLNGATLGGTNATSFALSGTCLTSMTVAAGGTCFLTVTYSPTVSGSLSAVVNINDNAPNTPQVISLSTH